MHKFAAAFVKAQQDGSEGRRPIVRVNDVRKPRQLSAQLKNRLAQYGKAERIIVKIAFVGAAVHAVAAESLFVIDKIYRQRIGRRHTSGVNGGPLFFVAAGNSQGTFEFLQAVFIYAVIARHNDTHIAALFVQRDGQSGYGVGKAARFCKGKRFRAYH